MMSWVKILIANSHGGQRYTTCMFRWLAVAALGAALMVLPAWAQRGGGGHGGFGGGHASFGGHMGFGGHAGFSAHPMGGFRGSSVTRGFGGSPWYGHGWGNGYPHGHYPGGRYPGGRNCWGGNCYYRNGWGYGYGYGYWPYAYAGWGWPWYDDYDDADNYQSQAPPSDYYYQPPEESPETQAELDRLHDEVAQLRDQMQSDARSVPRPPAAKESAPEPTKLVFADNHTEEVENYAIVSKNLWIFDGSRTRKIPLSALNIPATEKANQDQGVDFQIPD
jgi:hypothetical protein